MLWILTSKEFDELTLDGNIIPHGQWTLTLVLSYGLIEAFNKPQLGVAFIIVKVLCP